MLRGFYLASNGILNTQRTLNTIANNVANSQTSGFKGDLSVQNTFDRELILLNQGRTNETGTFEYKYTEESFTDFTQGSFEFTERPLDIAIQGPVYFNLETTEGDKVMTRNGQFIIDEEGFLAIEGAGRLLSNNGPVNVGTSNFSVSNAGEVYVDGENVGTLELSYIPNSDVIEKHGDNTFTFREDENGELPDATIPEDIEYAVLQGAFERSNIDVAVEMTRSMAAQNTFNALAQALQMLDEINTKTVDIGRI